MVSDGSYSMTIDGEEGTVIGRKRMNRRDGEVYVKDFIDMVSPSIIQFEIDHYVCGNTYRVYGHSGSTRPVLRSRPSYGTWARKME